MIKRGFGDKLLDINKVIEKNILMMNMVKKDILMVHIYLIS